MHIIFYVPSEEYLNLTGIFQQYWDIKSKHYDKLLFIESGLFFEIMYNAVIFHKELSHSYCYNEKTKKIYKSLLKIKNTLSNLVSKGYKIVIAEKIETDEKMKPRSIIENILYKKNTPKCAICSNFHDRYLYRL